MQPKQNDLTGMQVLITGASSGIGQQLALDFAKAGADLWLLARNKDRLQQVQQQCALYNVKVNPLIIDLANEDELKSVIPIITAQTGRLDVLINNAGMPCHKNWNQLAPELWKKVLDVNLRAPISLALDALPFLEKSHGHIINISSMAGLMVPPREMIYSASKFALSAFSEGIGLELEKSTASCSAIYVGPIDTPIWDKLRAQGNAHYNGKKFPPSEVSKTVMQSLKTR